MTKIDRWINRIKKDRSIDKRNRSQKQKDRSIDRNRLRDQQTLIDWQINRQKQTDRSIDKNRLVDQQTEWKNYVDRLR